MATWGFLSDIHGNLPMLERALDQCRAVGAQRFAFLGDLLGRGDSDAAVALIREIADLSVVGNRDLDWRDRVGPSTRQYVLGLPHVARADDFIVAHGDVRLDRDLSSAEIRAGFPRLRRRLLAERARLAFFGHTHHARAWLLSGADDSVELLHDDARNAASGRTSLCLDVHGVHYVVNVGTVGLPFPGKGQPSVAVYDTRRRTLQFIRIAE
jgi:predicted phosphodiesterase